MLVCCECIVLHERSVNIIIITIRVDCCCIIQLPTLESLQNDRRMKLKELNEKKRKKQLKQQAQQKKQAEKKKTQDVLLRTYLLTY